MSILSCLSHPALFIASVGGVALGVTLLLLPSKSMAFGGSFSHPFLSSSQINSLSNKTSKSIEKENNCEVISGLENVKKIIYDSTNYIAISCKNVGKGNDETLDNKWVALFHRNLLSGEAKSLVTGNKLDMSTVTKIQYEGDKYDGDMSLKTTFKSKHFVKEEIMGNWKYGRWYIDEKTVDDVTLEGPYSSEKIYFIHGHNKR